jgi:hypothetical protein
MGTTGGPSEDTDPSAGEPTTGSPGSGDPSTPKLDVGGGGLEGACGTPAAVSLATACEGDIALQAGFEDYTCLQLGSVPGLGATDGYAGIAFDTADASRLLVRPYSDPDGVYAVQLARDESCRVIGYGSDTAQLVWDEGAGFSDMTTGPDDLLVVVETMSNHAVLAQLLAGSTNPDATVGPVASDLGISGLGFPPAWFAGAGQLKLLAGNAGQPQDFRWMSVGVTFEANGSFSLSGAPSEHMSIDEYGGFVYVSGDSPGFGSDSVLITRNGSIDAYELDANGDPVPATERPFLTGAFTTAGADADPETGDFAFSAALLGDDVVLVSGFESLPPPG